MGTSRDKGRVFVTVGTTLFDALVKEVDSQECKQVLASHGYSSLLIQLGRGSFLPTKVIPIRLSSRIRLATTVGLLDGFGKLWVQSFLLHFWVFFSAWLVSFLYWSPLMRAAAAAVWWRRWKLESGLLHFCSKLGWLHQLIWPCDQPCRCVHYWLPPKSKEDKPCRNLKPVFLATLEPFETPCRCSVRMDIHVWIPCCFQNEVMITFILVVLLLILLELKLTETCEVYDHTHCCCHNFGFSGIESWLTLLRLGSHLFLLS